MPKGASKTSKPRQSDQTLGAFFMGMIMVADRRDEDHWKIDKKINIPQIVSAVLFLIGVGMWSATVESRFLAIASDRTSDQQKNELQMQIVNQEIKSITKQQEIQFETLNDSFKEMKGTVNNLNDKLDKVIQNR